MLVLKEKNKSFLKKIKIFDGATLKYIAMISMLMDHTNKAIIIHYLNGENNFLSFVSGIFDILGRIAFPIFCFMIVEGFYKTKNKGKYFLNLLLFGAVSEIPFDLFDSGVIFQPNANNIMFTFALLLLTLWCIDLLKQKINKILWYAISVCIVAVSSLIAMITGLDYVHYAIIIGYLYYVFYDIQILASALGGALMYKELWALLGFGLVLTYNGKRGKQNKWFNYWFYPVHLLLLGILRIILKI